MSDAVSSRTYLSRLWVLMMTVFVDMMGFLIVLPLLPFYAKRLGADPTRIGLLVSVFAVAQLATAPLWGRMSDRYGRRPMIIIGLAMSAVSYVLFEQADTVWILFASRMFQGIGAGTNGVVQAYLSDSVPAERRSQALGWLTAAASAGVMLGPAIASLAKSYTTIGPGYVAAGLCVLNLLSAWRLLPEPQRHGGESRGEATPGGTRRALAEVVRRPAGRVGAVIWIYAAGMMAFMAMNGILALYLDAQFGVTEANIGWFYTYVGGVSLLMRSLALGPAVRRFGEVRLLRIGALTVGAGLCALPLAADIPQLALAALLIPVGTAFLFPVTTSLVAGRAPENETGTVLGVQQMVGGVSRMIGPMWAGFVFQHVGIRSPFWIGSALMVATFLFSAVVRPDGHGANPAAVLPDAPS
jgi:MFS family permease